MAEIVLSALLPMLFEKLTSSALKTIARYKGADAEIKKWQRSLTQIQDVLADASQKEITSAPVKRWLNDLHHLAYDIDDVLDGWLTEAMQSESTHESEGMITSKVRKLIPTCCTNFSRATTMVLSELDNISSKLQDLVKEKDTLGLSVTEVQSRPRDNNNNNNNNRRIQTSVVDPSSIVGRQADKESLVQQLLLPANEPCDQNYSIVPILGMGGVGKTTLARLLYDDKQVKDHFELKAWVCVSDDFDSFAISKVIFRSMAGVDKKFSDFNQLQEELRTRLREKMFLLVLDDVWSESYADWETLVRPFYTCAPGSRIIITTRKDQLLKQLVHNPLTKQLHSLSNDDALSLFAQHALGVCSFDSHLSLKPYAEGIVKKCGGLPLALTVLGRLLRTKRDEVEQWKKVSNNEIWRLKDEGGIIPALKLSYHDLSATLKQLFAYCSLFPKDFLFNKEEVILLWTAEGFLHQPAPSDSTEESRGQEFFDELLSRSFFQHAPNNETLFVMHDLMNDLATSVATDFFLRLDNQNDKNIRKEMLEKHRHISFVRERYVAYKKFGVFNEAKSLRTFLATSVGEAKSWGPFYLSNKILTDLLPGLPFLRVLYLSHFRISEVPESIGTLRHLRYLNLAKTSITHLPEMVCNLYNLHTLILSGCDKLTKLPNNFLKLKNLRHLDVRDTPLLFQMLLQIGELKGLQITLSKIVLERENEFEIAKLKDFKNLHGNISIQGLEHVQNSMHAHKASFSQKRISELELIWSDELHDSRNQMLETAVLKELMPCHDTLMHLNIRSYGGLEFPKWVGDPLFLHLKHVSIRGCKRCTSLPPLGQLPSLKELFIESLYGVEAVDFKLTGAGGAFLSLEILSFKDMRGWKKWSGAVLPRLQKLQIYDCPNLVEVKLEAMPSLNSLQIEKCPNLVELSLEALPSLNDLSIATCDGGVLRRLVEVASTITKLEIRDISSPNDCPNLVEVTLEALPSLNDLSIIGCDSDVLRRLVEVASAVTKLEIRYISRLNDVVWGGVIEYLRELEELKIWECNEIKHLVKSDAVASKNFVKLRKLKVSNCDNLVSIGEKEEEDNCRSNLLPSLRRLEVWDCKNMERCICPDGIEVLKVMYCWSMTVVSFPKGGLQKLKSLEIRRCSKLLERELGGQQMNNNNRISMPMLECVSIYNWPNLKSINELNCLVHLNELYISKCESLEVFPNNLTCLNTLELVNCKSMDASLPGWVWPPNLSSLKIGMLKNPLSEWGPQKKLPTSLVELELYGKGEDGVDSWSQISHILPSSLTSLKIWGFEKLESFSIGDQELNSLQRLSFHYCTNMKKVCWHPQNHTSLHYLYIFHCPKMKDLPGKDSLTSLLSLFIYGDCPILKERCSKNGSYWPQISHIPCINI